MARTRGGGPSCLECSHAYMGIKGVYCEVFDDILVSFVPCPAFDGPYPDQDPEAGVCNTDTDLAPIIPLDSYRCPPEYDPDPA